LKFEKQKPKLSLRVLTSTTLYSSAVLTLTKCVGAVVTFQGMEAHIAERRAGGSQLGRVGQIIRTN